MIDNPQNLQDQLLNLTETIAVEMKKLGNSKLGKEEKAFDAKSADKATNDYLGNPIHRTYATKEELNTKAPKNSPTFVGTVVADKFSGELSGNAYSASRDQNGNIISSFYATKTELGTKLGKKENAYSASRDQSGNVITTFYATKKELNNKFDKSGGTVTGSIAVQGSATVKSKNIVTSINGLTADTNGNVTVNTTPAGTIIFTAGKKVPPGYLACNGQSLSTASYAALFEAIGYTYGGSGSSFKVPNFNNRFPEFTSNPSESGTVINPRCVIPEHYHTVGNISSNNGGGMLIKENTERKMPSGSAIRYWNGSGGWQGQNDVGATFKGNCITSLSGGEATAVVQPPAVKLLTCIKY